MVSVLKRGAVLLYPWQRCVCAFVWLLQNKKKNMWLFVSTSPKRPSILKSILKPRKPAYYIYTKVLPECKTPGTVSPFLVAGLNESRGGCGSNGAFRDREERAGQGTEGSEEGHQSGHSQDRRHLSISQVKSSKPRASAHDLIELKLSSSVPKLNFIPAKNIFHSIIEYLPKSKPEPSHILIMHTSYNHSVCQFQ